TQSGSDSDGGLLPGVLGGINAPVNLNVASSDSGNNNQNGDAVQSDQAGGDLIGNVNLPINGNVLSSNSGNQNQDRSVTQSGSDSDGGLLPGVLGGINAPV